MKTVLAGDLGGTKCRFALVTAEYEVLHVQRFATPRDRSEFLRQSEAALAAILAAPGEGLDGGLERPAAIGVGTAGVIPRGGRVVERAPNLPLDGFPLADHLEQRFRLPTTVLNDGRASAWGEFLRGRARGCDPLLCLFFGTGIGIGLIAGGRPFTGATDAAGEIGHTIWRPDGRRCACGERGHFEAYCGGRALAERAADEIGAPRGAEWTVDALVASAHPAAPAILADAEAAATALVANACTLLNPAAVVLGGGVLAGWPALGPAIEQFVRRHGSRAVVHELRFEPSIGGSDAILWGAAAATRALGGG
jgi:glucokinase